MLTLPDEQLENVIFIFEKCWKTNRFWYCQVRIPGCGYQPLSCYQDYSNIPALLAVISVLIALAFIKFRDNSRWPRTNYVAWSGYQTVENKVWVSLISSILLSSNRAEDRPSVLHALWRHVPAKLCFKVPRPACRTSILIVDSQAVNSTNRFVHI